MLFQSQVPAIFNQIGLELYSSATSARKRNAAQKLNFYFDLQLERLEEQLAELFSSPENMVKVSLNVVKKVINNLSQVYFTPPVRALENATEKDEQIYKQILEQSAFDLKMKQAQRLTKLLGTILIRPVWRNGAIALDILTGNILDVVTGDSPEILNRVLITDWGNSDKIQDVQYSLWTVETFQRLDYRGNVFEEEPNPYGVLPFLPCFDYPPPGSNFWLSNFESLVSIQEAINIKLTDLLYLIQQQSFGVGWIKGAEGGGSLKVDPGSLVELPKDKDAGLGFVSQQAEIAQVVNAIDRLLKWAAVSNGLSAATVSTSVNDYQSGIAKAFDTKELSELRADDVQNFRSIERQLFNLVRTVWNVHNPTRKISDRATLQIDFADPAKQSLTAKEQAEADEMRIAQGVRSIVDILLRDNPDFGGDREKALAHLLTIKEEMRLLIE
jgi:hypothetical protein